MAIDEKAHIGTGDETATTTGDARPHFIQTWPLTTDEHVGDAPSSEAADQEDVGPQDTIREPELVIPDTVKQWPT